MRGAHRGALTNDCRDNNPAATYAAAQRHLRLHADLHGGMESPVYRRTQDYHLANMHWSQEIQMVDGCGHHVPSRVPMPGHGCRQVNPVHQGAAQQRAQLGAQAADHRHGEKRERGGEGKALRAQASDERSVARPGDPGEEGAEREGEDDMAGARDAGALRRHRAHAQRHERAPGEREPEVARHPRAAEERRKQKIVVGEVVHQLDAEERRPRPGTHLEQMHIRTMMRGNRERGGQCRLGFRREIQRLRQPFRCQVEIILHGPPQPDVLKMVVAIFQQRFDRLALRGLAGDRSVRTARI